MRSFLSPIHKAQVSVFAVGVSSEMVGVALTVLGWFVSPINSKVIEKLISYLEENYDLHAGMENRLGRVKVALPRIEHAINVTGAWPIRDEALVAWVRHLKDAAHKADDLLDDLESKFHHDENKVRASGSSNLQAVKRTILTNNDLKNLRNLVNDLEKIYDDINNRLSELHQHNAQITAATRENRSFLAPQKVIGRNTETNDIVTTLLSCSTPSFIVLPIVGIGGVGKTALASHIFEDKEIFQHNHFSLRAWVDDLSHNFDIKKIANTLISIFSRNKNLVLEIAGDHRYDDASLQYMLQKLENMIRNQRFLIVLDDVWNVNIDGWNALHNALAHGARGSTVLVTTQNPRVAKIMETVNSVQLDVLKEDDYQRLLEQYAFHGQILEEHRRQNLQSIGRNIFKTLQHLPLAGKVLGNLLSYDLDPDYWNTILNSEWWEHNAVVENVLPSLGFSYQNLDPSQKLCFAYCSIFPKGYRFEENRLVHMWMAQGFIQSKTMGKMRIEDIGGQVFAEFVERNFFQRISENEYVMHDIIRELAVFLSLDECFVINDETEEIPKRVRHLTVSSNRLDAFSDLSRFKNLRTLLFFGNYETETFYSVLKGIFKCSKSLRVLDLSYGNTEISKLPEAIGKLSHLRYLDISNTTIRELPKLFWRLCHLQVLNLQQCHFNKLPEGMNELINLRHLCAESKTVSLISGIGKLTCLQELKEFHVRKEKGHKIEELRNLNNLRGQLLIQNLENVDSKEEAMNAKLREKKRLDALNLYFEIKDGLVTGSSFISTRMLKGSSKSKITPDLEGLLEGLEPCRDIKELGIKGYDSNMFPSWLVNKERFTSLKSIRLSSCDKLTSLPPLGQLPSLTDLHIETLPALRKIGVELYGKIYKVFPSLERLKLQDLKEFEEWSEVQGRQLFPCLRKLHIEQCLKLKKLALLMLNPPVEELQINSCGDLGSALPECLQRLTSLTMLKISDYQHRTSLSLSNLVALKNLCLSNCPELSFQGELQSLTDLKQLEITGCPKFCESLRPEQLHEKQGLRSLNYLHMDGSLLINNAWILLGNLPELQILKIFSCSHLVRLSEEQEMWLQQLTSLQELQFSNCDNLQYPPNSLVTLSSLKKLTICDCPMFMSLPENLLPASLRELHFSGCPLLKEQCQKERGPDWPNIAHVPRIYIDQETIQELQEESSDTAATSIS